MRQPWLDWMRTSAVLLVVVVHSMVTVFDLLDIKE